MKFTKFRDIPQFTRSAGYHVDVSWDALESWIARQDDKAGGDGSLELDPDFQRAHVWTEDQQIRYIEFVLRGGHSSKEIYFNHPNWMGSLKGVMELVDGKQRFEAARKFMRNEISVFGSLYRDFTDHLPLQVSFSINVNNLKTRAEVLQWYIDLNAGGVAHTDDEISKVRAMLADCENTH